MATWPSSSSPRTDLTSNQSSPRIVWVGATDAVSDGGVDSVGRRAHDPDDTIGVFTHVIPFQLRGDESSAVVRACAAVALAQIPTGRRTTYWAHPDSNHHGTEVADGAWPYANQDSTESDMIRSGAGTFEKIMSASVSSASRCPMPGFSLRRARRHRWQYSTWFRSRLDRRRRKPCATASIWYQRAEEFGYVRFCPRSSQSRVAGTSRRLSR